MSSRCISAIAVVFLLAIPTAAVAQDIFGDPYYGSVSLSSGFTPDPHTVEISVGGSVDAAKVQRGCEGFISDRPDYRLRFDSGFFSLPLYIWAESDVDTTLIINGPNGEWHCDDDSGNGLNPYVKFTSPDSGIYDIWVGAFSEESNYADAILHLSELDNQPGLRMKVGLAARRKGPPCGTNVVLPNV